MDKSLRAQIETYLSHLDGLIRRGRQLRDTLATGAGSTWSPPENGPSSKSAIVATRVWQEDCGVTINQLSGGSKAHWLARWFCEAFLMRSTAGTAVAGAAPDANVKRPIHVLEQDVRYLTGTDDVPLPSAAWHASDSH